jgi:gliding motility-associated-like protein
MKAFRNLNIRLLLFLVASILSRDASAQFYITTVAGDGSNGSNGDNGPAVCAGVPNPQGVCADHTGNLYVTSSNAVRRVDVNTNNITSVAGSDSYGYAGDGGPAKNALLMYPYDVCLDRIGNLYVSEYSGNRIRKISTDGTITTYAGTGVEGYSGDNGPATAAQIARPRGIITDDKNNLYIADTYNSVVRKVDAATGIITTIAGTGSTASSGDGAPAINAGVPFPTNVGVDDGGNIYLLEVNAGITSRLRKIDAVTGIITTLAGSSVSAYSGDGGLAINASLLDPVSVEIDNRRNIYILEYDEPRLRKIDANTGIISTVAGNGVNDFSGDGGLATLGSMHNPGGTGLGFNGAIYVADQQNHRIRKLHPNQIQPIVFSKINVEGPAGEPCAGTSVMFTADITNAGSQAKYEWHINNLVSGGNNATFVTSDVLEGDSVYCVFTSTHCGNEEIITSNKVAVHFGSDEPVQVVITPSAAKVCRGDHLVVTASVLNASSPVYQWYKNDQQVGSNSASFDYLPVSGDDRIRCDVITQGCVGGVASSEEIIVGAYPSPVVDVTPEHSTVPPGTPVALSAQINGSIVNYTWSSVESLLNDNTLTPTTSPVINSHDVIFTCETADGCVIRDTAKIFVFVKMVMPNAFSPNGDGINDEFRIPPNVTFQLDEFSVFNRWGKKIFSTASISKGWSGNNADNGTYVYYITGLLQGKKTVFKGTFLLAR